MSSYSCKCMCIKYFTTFCNFNTLLGNTDLIEKVLESCEVCEVYDEASSRKHGKTPLHIAAKYNTNKDASSKVLSFLLKKNIIDARLKDKKKKTAKQYIPPKDERELLFVNNKEPISQKKKKRKKAKHGNVTVDIKEIKQVEKSDQVSNGNSEQVIEASASAELPKIISVEESELDKSNNDSLSHEQEDEMISVPNLLDADLSDKKSVNKSTAINQNNDEHKDRTSGSSQSKDDCRPSHKVTSVPLKEQLKYHMKRLEGKSSDYFHSWNGADTQHKPSATPRRMAKSKDKKAEGMCSPTATPVEIDSSLTFDELPWEVEITKSVLKFFKGTKKLDHLVAAKAIHQIAEGRRDSQYVEVGKKTEHCCLYVAHIPNAGHILWEKAIAYSSKLSNRHGCEIYTQIIRVWEITSDENLKERIKSCSGQIEESYKNGEKSPACLSLKERKQAGEQSHITAMDFDLPSSYELQQIQQSGETKYCFIPLVTSNKMEYNVNTFYSFDTMVAMSMIDGANEKRDYPFI